MTTTLGDARAMTPPAGRRIVLGVCGGIAAYKAAALTSRLVQRGDDVTVIMSENAARFVGPLTFAALTQRPVHTSLWDDSAAIAHIALARACDVVAVVPATANTIAKLALGLADDLLTNVALATRAPLVVAPAMNDVMYAHAATRDHLATLERRGVTIVAPGVGFLAEREHGVGRLADEAAILAALDAALARRHDLAGERIVVTAGPTREALDPVRFLSNASTGSMGIAIAREAYARGAAVDLILGPTSIEPPPGVAVMHVTSAAEMHAATLERAREATVAVATAAVADWRPAHPVAHKIKKTDAPAAIELERTPDILADLGAAKGTRFLIGFAAETDDHERHAREKLARKNLDVIAVNDVAGGAGFGPGDNALVLLWGDDGRHDLGRAPKPELAGRFWDAVLPLLRAARTHACS